MQTPQSLKTFFERYKKLMISVQQAVFLHAVYVIGIGFTAILAKVFNKHFVTSQIDESSWLNYKKSNDSSRMF